MYGMSVLNTLIGKCCRKKARYLEHDCALNLPVQFENPYLTLLLSCKTVGMYFFFLDDIKRGRMWLIKDLSHSLITSSLAFGSITSFRLRGNSVYFQECSPLWVGISTIYIYILKMFEIGFFFVVKDNNLFPFLHNIRLSYNKQKCLNALLIRMHMST